MRMKMKKKYITPTVRIVDIEIAPIMENSIPAKSNPINDIDQVW